MFSRFTERARQVVIYAHEAARQMGDNTINTRHVLIGLVDEQEGLGARVLATLGVAREKLVVTLSQGELVELAPATRKESQQESQQIPFSNSTRTGFELALREALTLGHNYIGTEHLLLGVVRNECLATKVLADILGVEDDGSVQEKVRTELLRSMVGPQRKAKRPDRRQAADPSTATFERFLEAVLNAPSQEGLPGEVLVEVSTMGWTVKVPISELRGVDRKLHMLSASLAVAS